MTPVSGLYDYVCVGGGGEEEGCVLHWGFSVSVISVDGDSIPFQIFFLHSMNRRKSTPMKSL